MKKFTSLMLMLLCAATTMWAQTLVTDATTISDSKVYTLAPSNTASTGVICVPGTDATMLYMSTHSSATQDIDATNINQRFAFITAGDRTFMYSLGAQKFVADNDKGTSLLSISDITTECDIVFRTSTGSAKDSYPLVVEVGGDYLCISNASWWADYGYVLTNWNDTGDAGCMMALTEYDPTETELELIASVNNYFSTVDIATIDAEYAAAKDAAQAVLNRSFTTSDGIAAINTALDDAATAYSALNIADDNTISLADATTFREYIAAINTATDAARVYLASTDDMSNNIAYAISTYDRGSWVSNGTAITGTTKAGIAVNAESPAQQFAFIESENGNLYLYSVNDAKFVGKSGANTSLSETPVQAVTLLQSNGSTDFPWVVALVAGEDSYNHMGISNGYDPAVITFWNDLADRGNQARLELVTTLSDDVVNAALEQIAAYENGNTEAVAALGEAITNANNLVAYIGTGVGYYTYTGNDDFETKFNEIVDFYNAIESTVEPTTEEVEAKTAELNALVAAFSLNMPEADKVYALDSYMSYLYNNIDGSTAVKTNGTSSTDTKALWKFIQVDGGYNIQNVHTGLYINGTAMSETPGLFTLEGTAQENGTVNAQAGQLYIKIDGSDNCLHSTAENAKSWSGAGLGNQYAFVEVNEFSHTLTVSDAGWSTLVLGFNATIPSGVTAYAIASEESSYVTLEEVTGVLGANVPVIIEATAGTYDFAYTTETATVTASGLNGTLYNKNIAANAYVLGILDEVVGFYKAELNQNSSTAFLNNANKAYFVPATSQSNVASYSFRFGEGTTGIDQITDNRVQSTAIYDLTGRRVENVTAPGIYIVGGKKVLVK